MYYIIQENKNYLEFHEFSLNVAWNAIKKLSQLSCLLGVIGKSISTFPWNLNSNDIAIFEWKGKCIILVEFAKITGFSHGHILNGRQRVHVCMYSKTNFAYHHRI